MISLQQIEELAKYYQIDGFTIYREYLQLLFLNYLYQHKKSAGIYFKGGTAIHLLLDSPRFSEDLDFSSLYSQTTIAGIIEEVEKQMNSELPGIKVSLLYWGRKSIRFRLVNKTADFKYPFVIRIDFSREPSLKKIITSPLVTRFPIVFFPIITHLSVQEILAEKIRALLTRAKGRDIFDLWFLLEKGINIDRRLAIKKLKETNVIFAKEKLSKKIISFSQKKLTSGLSKFLPKSQRRILGILKKELLKKLEQRETLDFLQRSANISGPNKIGKLRR